MRKIVLAIVLMAICPLLIAQQALNNGAVIQMVKAGLSDDLILSTINAQAGSYDTTADGLIALKTAGVSDKVVTAIVLKAARAATAVQASQVAQPASLTPASPPSFISNNPNDPAAAHADGIYLFSKGTDGSSRLIQLQSKQPRIESNAGKAFASGFFTLGTVPVHGIAVLDGTNATIVSSDSRPVFYAYNQSADNLTLAKFTVKSHERLINVFSVTIVGANMGEDARSQYAFQKEEIRPGVVKLTSLDELPYGEYAVQVGDHTLFYDFGVYAGQ